MWWLIGSVILGCVGIFGLWSMLAVGKEPPKPKRRVIWMKFWGGLDG